MYLQINGEIKNNKNLNINNFIINEENNNIKIKNLSLNDSNQIIKIDQANFNYVDTENKKNNYRNNKVYIVHEMRIYYIYFYTYLLDDSMSL